MLTGELGASDWCADCLHLLMGVQMGRLLFALLIGLIVHTALVAGVQLVGSLINPLPPGVDASSMVQMRDYLAAGGIPLVAMLMVLLSYAAGNFGGAFVASKLAPNRGLMPALVIGQISLVLVIINLVMMPHPIWMSVASVCIPLPLAWLGGRAAHARGGLK
jgi:hypothetical protein